MGVVSNKSRVHAVWHGHGTAFGYICWVRSDLSLDNQKRGVDQWPYPIGMSLSPSLCFIDSPETCAHFRGCGGYHYSGSNLTRIGFGVGKYLYPYWQIHSSGGASVHLRHPSHESPGNSAGVKRLQPRLETHHVLRTSHGYSRLYCPVWPDGAPCLFDLSPARFGPGRNHSRPTLASSPSRVEW